MPMSLEQIFSGVGVDTARRLARVGRMIEQQQKFDSAVATGFKRPNNYRNALGELSVQLTNTRRHQQDSDLADALLRILKSQPLTKVVEQAAVCCGA
jgi:hypothetical protein